MGSSPVAGRFGTIFFGKKVEGDIASAVKTGEIRSDKRRGMGAVTMEPKSLVTDLNNSGFADGDDSDLDWGDDRP